jgi:hypothetical protein
MTVCHYSSVQYQTAGHLWYKETGSVVRQCVTTAVCNIRLLTIYGIKKLEVLYDSVSLQQCAISDC